ncbi:hypothetical protein LY28_00005 [Ruminiclostridium sufflavum DSM 19573]|uniref:Uncharacterized protein n=1 Tax=Ruminiclostridium sufflavum DSM 19573 TaxID=1121337 RepID=A0A318XQ01_9FIRM|nr:hypothetical protein [Ruminiclostridium sufflavum]PYG90125.1 hypothetical protein LY28_00005 [Ruminiclostridium sufflavum DSM 19573]
MKEKFAKLIDVKTIVTFALVGALIGFVATGKLEAKEVVPLVTMAVSFFFAVKLNKA